MKRRIGAGSISQKNKVKAKFNPNSDSWVSQTFAQAMESSFIHPLGRGPELRPSSFPQCSVKVWMQKYRGAALGQYNAERKFSMEYFTGVGTTVHEISQLFMGLSKVQYGHWKCLNPKCIKGIQASEIRTADGSLVKAGKITRKFSCDNICPKCALPMFYVELEVNYKGTKGHIDGVWKIPKSLGGGYWVIDYKTTGLEKVKNGKENFPDKKHLAQLPVYAYILRKKYKMDIKGFSLIYMPRDNPFSFYEYREDWSKKWSLHSSQVLKENTLRYNAVLKDLTNDSFSESIYNKPCSSEREYRNKMHSHEDCYMLDVCFSPNRLKSRLDQWKTAQDLKLYPNSTLEQTLEIIKDKDYKKLGVSKVRPNVKHETL
jgi:hypothetical protein